MDNFHMVIFNKFLEEDFLVDFVTSILKNLSHRNCFFYLDDVLIDKEKYYFIFGGNTKFGILINEIKDYLPVQKHYMVI